MAEKKDLFSILLKEIQGQLDNENNKKLIRDNIYQPLCRSVFQEFSWIILIILIILLLSLSINSFILYKLITTH